MLAEQIDPYTDAPLSVSPLTWSHAEFAGAIRWYIGKARHLRQSTARTDVITLPILTPPYTRRWASVAATLALSRKQVPRRFRRGVPRLRQPACARLDRLPLVTAILTRPRHET